MKMFVPGTKQIMAVATFDRSTPKEGGLRQGLFLNTFGLLGAVFGTIFQRQTRAALGFGAFNPTPSWVVYASIGMCVGLSTLIAITIALQHMHEKTWSDDSEFPVRWLIISTLPTSIVVSGLAVWFLQADIDRYWPVLDALTWVSGIPLGIIENGRMIPADLHTVHLVLINRWIMGAVASSLGSHRHV